jgi:hypothetical protein
MKYHAKDLKDIAKHFDYLAKDSKTKLDRLREKRQRCKEIMQLEVEFHCYCNARDILLETELKEDTSP